MCGIAGIYYFDRQRPIELARLANMAHAIHHRGPDGGAEFIAPGVGLAHRRLSIIDLAGGTQPLGNEDGSVQVVFNGEIYNYQSLRRELEGQGHRFATHSDTEVLVHLYEQHGDDFVTRLRGMFALAIYDGPRHRLLLARDRLGIKPLYWYRDEECLLFCSELKGLLAHGERLQRHVDPSAIENYLAFGMIAGTQTIFRDARKLAPAHRLVVDANQRRCEPVRYWELTFSRDESRTVDDWRDQLTHKVGEAVDLHLIADVPVGSFLSGGLDSSVITALAAGKTSEPIQTFSIGFRESRFNELPYARQVAEKYGTRHVEEIVTADAVSLLDQLCWHYDEPFADTSAIPTMLVSRLAARHVKVVLSGDGGDEAFGGYARYAHDLREASLRACLPAWFRRSFVAAAARLWPQADWLPRVLRGKSALTNLATDASAAYANTLTSCRLPLRHQLLSADLRMELVGHDPHARLRDAYHRGCDDLSGMIATDVVSLLPDDYLVKVDRASMAFGLEVRPPLLDHELLELAARIPSSFKIRDGETKWIMKQTFESLLPTSLLTRPKQGFEIPVDEWFRGPLSELFRATVLRSNSVVSQWLDVNKARKLLENHMARRQTRGNVLWSLLVLARWAEMFCGAAVAERPSVSAAVLAAS